MIGIQLKKIRKEFGYTQTTFASLIGKSLSTIQDWEAGKTLPPDTAIKLICVTLNLNEQWLRDGSGSMFTKPNPKIQSFDKLIFAEGSHFTDTMKEDLTELIELILEYGTPKTIKQFKNKMIAIKKIHDSE